MKTLPSNDTELAKLTEAAIGVLEAHADDDVLELESMPPEVISDEIAEAARSLGIPEEDASRLADAASAPTRAPAVARAVLGGLVGDERLGEEIEDAYARRSDLLAIDPLSISAAALLILVLRVRRVRVSKRGGVDVELDVLKPEVVKAVLESTSGPS